MDNNDKFKYLLKIIDNIDSDIQGNDTYSGLHRALRETIKTWLSNIFKTFDDLPFKLGIELDDWNWNL